MECKPGLKLDDPAVVHPDIDGMVTAVRNGDLDGMISRMGNVLALLITVMIVTTICGTHS